MKREFTKLMAALALLTFLAVPMGMWGQTRETTKGTLDMSTSQTSPVTVNDVTFTWTSANIVTGGGNSSGFKANSNMTVTIPSGAILTKIEKTNGNNWGSGATISVYAGSDATGTNIASIVTGTHVYNISSNNTGTTYYFANKTTKNAWIKSLSITYEVSSGASTTVTIDATGITNTDVYTSTVAGSLSATVSANGEAITGATVAWSSSNENVATIDEDGVVTLVASGTTTITAAYGGESGVYNPSSATYELAVTSSAPYVQPTTVEIIPNYTFWGKTGQFSGDTYSELEGIKDNVTLNWTRGNGSTYANTQAMRFYKDNNLTFTAPEGYEITSIVLEVSGTYNDLTFDPTGYDNTTTTWTGSSQTVTMSRPSNASSYATISKFTITLAAIGNAVATTTTINVPANFNNDIYQGTTAGTLTATVTPEGGSALENPAITWSSSNTSVATIDANGAVTLVAVGTTTITASYAGVEDEYRPSEGSYELTVVNEDPNAPGTLNNPYNVAQARDAINAGTGITDVYVRGIVSYSNSLSDGEITYWISDDGTENDEIQVYRGKGINGDDFTDSDDIQVGDVVVVYGTLSLYGSSTYQFNYGNQLVSLTRPASITVNPATANPSATDVEGTLAITYANLTISDMDDLDVQFCDSEGNALASGNEPDWIEVLIAEDNNEYLVSYTMDANEGYARTAYFKVYANYDQSNVVYSNLVTITQGAYVVPGTSSTYELYTGTLTEGDYIIYYNGYAMKNTANDGGRLSYETVTPHNDVIATEDATIVWHIAQSGDYWTIYSANANAYAASTGAKNKAQMLADGTDDMSLWSVSGTTTYEFINKKNHDNEVNENLRNNGTNGFACYSTQTGGALSLYKKVASSTTETYPLTIAGFAEGNDKGGYRLIASPVLVHPSEVDGMTDGDYDLYKFDQSKNEAEWRNYKKEQFYLIPGKGYLYAKKGASENFEFSLEGVAYDGEGEIELSYTQGNKWAGWNLVGNPFGEDAVISDDYYEMSGDGDEIVTGESRIVAAMQGVFVKYADAGSSVIFEPATTGTNTGNDKKVVLNLTRNRGNVIDRAIVRFGEGRQLPKFQLNPNHTKLYITEGNTDYAVVRSANQGEMPVNFKAEIRGTYTLSVNTENVEMTYLHLFDNKTGADVDLLATPSYTFNANTGDNVNRFRLVFKANADVEENAATETFAYFNGSEWVINNPSTGSGDNATLQVVDMMGRVLSSETLNGNANVNINQPAGVYMLRLINGENVKVQKVVVR